MALALDAVGSPITALSALSYSAGTFVGAVPSGHAFGAAVALITAPAVVANGFLNGQVTLGLPHSTSP